MPIASQTEIALQCLRCHAPVRDGAGEGFTCTACGATYPKVGGVARFVDAEHYTGSFGYQWNRFSKTQLDSANRDTRSRDTFVEKTGWTLDQLKGKRILDAGCGMGRFAEIAADAGADVHAIDLSTAVEAASRNLSHRPNVSFYQADIFKLPFAPESFDYIYSIGVLHHTPDTKQAFLGLTRLLKPGGRISIWVYASRLARTMIVSEMLRPLTTKLSKPTLLSLCRVAVPLYHLHRLPVIGKVSRGLMPTSTDPDPAWRWLDTFDWYSPTYQWKHSEPEVIGWFKEAGLGEITTGPVPTSVFGAKAAQAGGAAGSTAAR